MMNQPIDSPASPFADVEDNDDLIDVEVVNEVYQSKHSGTFTVSSLAQIIATDCLSTLVLAGDYWTVPVH